MSKRRKHGRIQRVFETLETRLTLDSTVVFNEIMYHPTDPDGILEFVELYNQMAVDMDISSWRLDDGIEFTFPKGTIVPGGGYLVVAKDPAALLAATGVTAMGPFEGRLSNGGEDLELRDRNDRLMDALEYSDDAPWPLSADGAGASISKLRLHAGTDRAENWGSSILVGGTPGRSNFGETLGPPPEPTVTTVITEDARWSYWVGEQAPASNWTTVDFNAAGWVGTGDPNTNPGAIYYAGDARVEGTQDVMLDVVAATASSNLPGLDPIYAANGAGLQSQGHVTSPGAGTMWLSNGNFFGLVPDLNPEITFDLGQEQSLESMRVWNYNNVDSATCCLDRGMAVADILVAGEDGQFQLLIDNQAFDRAPGTVSNFSQLVPLSGTTARYIKFDVDTTNGVANHGDALSFVGLSEVQFLTAPVAGSTELPRADQTAYFRHEFAWQATNDHVELLADLLLDDGAVVYLNGTEIYRHNLPAGPIDHNTTAVFEVADAAWIRDMELPAGALRAGTNVLAVELHQASPQDTDLLFATKLTAVVTPRPPISVTRVPLAINEVAAAGTNQLRVELHNFGDQPLDLSAFRLVHDGAGTVPLPLGTVAPQGFVIVAWNAGARTINAGDRLYLYDASGERVFDAVEVHDQTRVRVPDGTGIWYVSDLSLGAPNTVEVIDQIVINEIMYHHRANTVGTVDDQDDYRRSDEEWIELYNRGNTAVDISGWSLAAGTEFTFPAGTVLGPDQYLVVSNDAAALRAKYPAITSRIVGDLERGLSNTSDHIVLLDARGNQADSVEYFENGQWPMAADGGGSSLELRDPFADNSVGLAWGASDESTESPWRTYTYRGTPSRSSLGPDGVWHELVLGLLADGEVLLDDIRVIQNPDAEAIQLIHNSDFSGDTLGASPAGWRIIGNHRHSEVIVDPNDPTNQVLRLVATGVTEHMHNHAEITLKDGNSIVQISNRAEYEISYRAKWISGSNQLNSRLYFNRLARTTALEQPEFHGTPGAVNSNRVENLGPTYQDFLHQPAVPAPGQATTVSVAASDPQGVAAMTLWYAVDSGAWNSLSMGTASDGMFSAQIPGQSAGSIVQFYVEGSDSAGALTTFPRAGRDSRALYQVNDGKAETNGLHNLRMILTPDDADFLHTDVELMSNDQLGATIIYNESEIFYDAGVRLSGSQRARTEIPRLSFNVSFNSDQLFRGVHAGIALDRSESTGFGQRELIYHHGMSQAGGLPSEYNDLFHIITPRSAHTGPAEAQLARYTDLFLDSQYENGSSGQLYEYELTYYPTTTDDRTPEGRKLPKPDSVQGTAMRNLGDSKEDYRWAFLNKNNRGQDDYRRLMEFAAAMGTRVSDFNNIIGDYIDVDQWLRAFAFSTISGHGDNYGADGSQHNLQLFIRPSDQRVEFFPHDLDAFFDARRPLIGNPDLTKLLRVPANEHHYLGHVHDMIQTTFNEEYMKRWTDHFGSLLPRQNFDRHLRDLVTRSNFLLGEIQRRAPVVEFVATGDSVVTPRPTARLQGTGWVNVREIRLAGASSALDVLWTDATDWQVDVPVNVGRSDVTLEAFDFQGEKIGSIVVPVTRQPGDFSGDGTVDGTDLDQLCQFLQAGDLQGDLNGDLQADFADLQVMVNQIMGTSLGDANLDGVFNSRDLVQVFQVGQYEDAVAGNSRWSDGDWNCDGDFTSRDIVLAFQNGGYVAGAQAAASSDGMATQLAIESEPHWRSVDIAFALLALDDAFDSDPRRSTNR